ncbi:MAG TPA: OsmC family protein [Desulfosporosinus sp.]|nr:OsmC family protein [Desulfosporosinus sp.]
MSHQLEVSVDLTNQKVQFTGVARANLAISIDCLPPLGDGQGYTPLELLLISLASCSGTTVLTLLRKMKKNISGIKVNAKGIRRDQAPTSFQTITLEFVISSEDVQSAEVQKAIKLTEETYCPVWTMLKNNVEVNPEFRIVTQ